MIKLTRVTKEALTLKFNPKKGLSNASLEGRNVTSEIRYLQEDDYIDCLESFGFRSKWPALLEVAFTSLNEKLAAHNLAMFNAHLLKPKHYGIYLCDLKDEAFIHKTTRAVMLYNIEERKLVQVVRLFELSNKLCNTLLQEDWS